MVISSAKRRAAVRLFDGRLGEEWIGFTILRRVIIAVATVHFSLAAASGYRAIFQVYSVNIELPSSELRPGSSVTARFVASGRVPIAARMELVQGTHVEPLGRVTVPENKSFFYDPRPQRAAIGVTVSPDVLSRFQEGAAVIRAVGEGRSQFVRVPPPRMREVPVTLIR